MLILLPPSEGKRSGGDGPPVDIAGLSSPSLGDHRRRVAEQLQRVCAKQPRKARELLGLSEALDGDRAANAELWTSATMPAGHRYAGVLHDALSYPTLTAAARRRADRQVVTFSGLWGLTRPTDLIPAYRIGINTVLPRIGPLPAFWRDAIHAALNDEIIERGAIDLRSTGYTAMYRPSPEAAQRTLTVRLLRADGQRAASSYASKVAKGLLVRQMLTANSVSADGAAEAATTEGFTTSRVGPQVTLRIPDAWPPPRILPT